MRISRKKKKPTKKKNYYYNEKISATEVMVLDTEGNNIGVMSTVEALCIAREQELDLVLINPKNNPPVVKMVNFGQFRYQKEKEERKKQAKQHVTELKGVRLSMRIGPHDLEIRRKQTLKFLNGGDKVKLEIILRGRENRQKPRGIEIMRNFIKSVNEIEAVRTEQEVETQFNKITSIVAKK